MSLLLYQDYLSVPVDGLFPFLKSAASQRDWTGKWKWTKVSKNKRKKGIYTERGMSKKTQSRRNNDGDRVRERERSLSQNQIGAVCCHTNATVSWHHNSKWCLAGTPILLANVHTRTHTRSQISCLTCKTQNRKTLGKVYRVWLESLSQWSVKLSI